MHLKRKLQGSKQQICASDACVYGLHVAPIWHLALSLKQWAVATHATVMHARTFVTTPTAQSVVAIVVQNDEHLTGAVTCITINMMISHFCLPVPFQLPV